MNFIKVEKMCEVKEESEASKEFGSECSFSEFENSSKTECKHQLPAVVKSEDKNTMEWSSSEINSGTKFSLEEDDTDIKEEIEPHQLLTIGIESQETCLSLKQETSEELDFKAEDQKMPKRARWSEEQLKAAMKAVNDGMSVNKASEIHKIPRRTLRDHIKTGSQIRKLGRNPYLSKEREDELCARIFRLSEIGMPITGKFLCVTVFNFCLLNNIPHPFDVSKRSAGRKWLRLFLQRHPEVRARKALDMIPGRALKLNKFIVNDHFSKLRNILINKDIMIKPERIYNIDEKRCRLTVHHQQAVLARRGAKRVGLVAPEHAESVTIVACANALGIPIPPMVIFKGQRLKPEWKKDMPPGTETVMSVKGCMTTAIFIRWLDHFARYKVQGEVVLIFDGASSHLDANIASAADKHGITLYCLPSNATHELQPMDKAVFKPFETFWDEEIMLFFDRQKTSHLRKSNFGEVFNKVWTKALTSSNIQSGFRACGIYPFDPYIIPDEAFAPSAVSHEVEKMRSSEDDDSSFHSSESEDNPRAPSLLKTILVETQSPHEQETPKSSHCCSIQNDNGSPITPFSEILSAQMQMPTDDQT